MRMVCVTCVFLCVHGVREGIYVHLCTRCVCVCCVGNVCMYGMCVLVCASYVCISVHR